METQEQLEWDEVNKLLQHHGFKPVRFSDPVENRNLSDLVLLDRRSAADMRTTLKMMLTDSERRQVLIQELIRSNNQLKEDAQDHMTRAAHHSQRVTEVEGLLDAVKTRVQDLEDRCLGEAVQKHSLTRQLQQEKLEAQELCKTLELKLVKQKEEAAELQKKLYFTVKEEERRLARQNETFQNICNRVVQHPSPTDQQVLDVIDFYETKMTQVQDELRSIKGEPKPSPSRLKKPSSSVTPPFRTVVRACQEDQNRVEALTAEVGRLRRELETRPTVKDMKFYKHKVRLLERSSKHSTRPEGSKTPDEPIRDSDVCVQYQQLLSDISSVLSNPKAPFQLHRQKLSSGLEFQTLLPTLEVWAQQLHLLQHLQRALHKLGARLMPWQPPDGGGGAEAGRVEDMMLLVDTMLENTSSEDEQVLRSPTRYTLGSMVSHFQKLFDVGALSGVYPRMNEVYTRLGEMTNAMRNLRDLLELDSRAPPTQVVNQVARLVSCSQLNAGFQDLLRDADIDSIIVKVKQHDDFFPPFHALMLDILQTLGVTHLDDVLPALRCLKRTD
ncbi:centrosomal protein of 70 kDa isoform X2 [Antennarius striatus]|uniref:centrosomal protein of 70 kDa isoform X2 n=1 Tax=Antennarius striatus TaxID=241820 RepID=UPI0035B24FC3